MTLITVFDAATRRERGWDFPGYPEGVWTSGGLFGHDASGGQATAQVNVATAGTPEGIAYSIEAFEYETSANTNVDLLLEPVNFDITAGLSIARGYQMVDVSGAAALAVVSAGKFERPWFLGQIVDRSIASAVSIVTANVTGKTSVFHLSGYFWTPRSVLQAEGGYRRPPDGLFSI